MRIVFLLAAGMAFVAVPIMTSHASAQQPPAAAAPEPQMPPMPSMEGQQGDVSKPVTQIPSRKKAPPAARKSGKKTAGKPARSKKKR